MTVRLDSPNHAAWRCAGVARRTLTCDPDTRRAMLCEDGQVQRQWDDPLQAIDWMARSVAAEGAAARWVGYFSYDLCRLFERIPEIIRPVSSPPLFAFGFIDSDLPDEAGDPPPPRRAAGARSNFTRHQFQSAVGRVIDYIAAGDVYQVNLSQRFEVATRDAPEEIYARLLRDAPGAYSAYLDLGDRQLLSNSPELFFRIDPMPDGGREIVNRPIKGTRPRGPGMEQALRQSAKDMAELAMIVDLQRNDLGRICRIGSVRVTDPRTIEVHPTVVHGVATINGELRPEVGLSDLLRAVFPCGSITGCPKIRAMQIIEELEPVRRGAYCGAIGYIAGDGSMRFNVAIRTMTLHQGVAQVPVGGGIVADSRPADEFEETIVKARAMFAALGVQPN